MVYYDPGKMVLTRQHTLVCNTLVLTPHARNVCSRAHELALQLFHLLCSTLSPAAPIPSIWIPRGCSTSTAIRLVYAPVTPGMGSIWFL